tara:strand:+ start:601 stop:1083 length:483 start_codon:yes stop_codon:yes gene_type:complete
MGTRSLTYIEESWETAVADEENNNKVHETKQNILCMYRQYDGYLSGHGAELAEFLQDFNVVNGIGIDNPPRTANGMGCLAAQLIVHFKANGCKEDGTPVSSLGGIYIYHSNAQDCGEEFTYTIYKNKGKLCIRAYDVWSNEIIFDGSPEKLIEKLETQKV